MLSVGLESLFSSSAHSYSLGSVTGGVLLHSLILVKYSYSEGKYIGVSNGIHLSNLLYVLILELFSVSA